MARLKFMSKGKQRRDVIGVTTKTTINTMPQINLVIGELIIPRKGCFSVGEMIAYETAVNSMAEPTIEYMALALDISEELKITHREAIDKIEETKYQIVIELIGYADRIKAIASKFSDYQRKKSLVADFIRLRCKKTLTDEELNEMKAPMFNEIYDFMINEFREWQKPPSIDLGKQ
jgi:hypothetical protein